MLRLLGCSISALSPLATVSSHSKLSVTSAKASLVI